MGFIELVQTRFSVRSFLSRPVEHEAIMKVMEAVRLAPSAVNRQPWKFIVISDRKMLEALSTTYDREWFETAPMCIVACGDHTQAWHRSDGKDHCDIDVAIAIDHLTLAASEIGLGTCWVCNFDVVKCAKILSLPNSIEPIALIPIGYPNVNKGEKVRKTLEEIIEFI